MKLPVDPKFLSTAGVTFLLLLVVILAVHAVAGPAAAGAAGAVVGAVAVKFFDKLDYTPTLELGAPRISAPWLYSIAAGVFLLYGCTALVDIAFNAFRRFNPDGYTCTVSTWVVLIPLDWGGFLLGGWIIGRLFSQRALLITSVAALVLVAERLLGSAPDIVSMQPYMDCFGARPPSTEELRDARSGAQVGAILGIASRAYLAILMARLASKKPKTIPPAPQAAA